MNGNKVNEPEEMRSCPGGKCSGRRFPRGAETLRGKQTIRQEREPCRLHRADKRPAGDLERPADQHKMEYEGPHGENKASKNLPEWRQEGKGHL